MAQAQDTGGKVDEVEGAPPTQEGADGATGAAAVEPEPEGFDAVFDELMKDGAQPAAIIGKQGTAKAPAATEGALPLPGEVDADGKAKGAGEAPGATGAAAPEPEPKPEPAKEPATGEQQLDPQKFLRDLAALAAQKPEPAAAAEAEPKPYQPTPFTADEQKIIADFARDYPDIHAAQTLQRRQEYEALSHAIVDHIFKQLQPILTNTVGTTQALSNDVHAQQLYNRVPDYADIQPKVAEWIKNANPIYKPSLEKIAMQGSVDEVVGLIDLFRKDTGTAAPAGKVPATGAPAGKAPVVPASRKAPAGLAPVTTKRGDIPTPGVAADDFDAAFEEASSQAA